MAQIKKRLPAGLLAIIVTMALTFTVGFSQPQTVYAETTFDYGLWGDGTWSCGEQTGTPSWGTLKVHDVDGEHYYQYDITNIFVKSQSADGVAMVTTTEHGWHIQAGDVEGTAVIEIDITNPQEVVDKYHRDQYEAYTFTMTVVADELLAEPIVQSEPTYFAVTTKTVNAKAKKKTKIKAGNAFIINDATGKITYKKLKGNKKVKISNAGTVTVKKGLKKGKSYKVVVAVSEEHKDFWITKKATLTVNIR